MKFNLLDRIIEVVPEQRLRAIKAVTSAEEYLSDHFPTFPVLPGVFMLEAMVEAAGWLVRVSQDFHPSIVLLQEARNVTYKSFVRPGQVLDVTVTCRRMVRDASDFVGAGRCGETEVVKARFSLSHFRLASRGRAPAAVDLEVVTAMKARYARLCGATPEAESRLDREDDARSASG